MTPLVARALEIAVGEIGVRELGRNRGERVDAYIRSVGLDPTKGSYPWCVCFAQWCFRKAAQEFGVLSPLPRTAGVHRLWRESSLRYRSAVPEPGALFLVDHGHGVGHVGFVEHVDVGTPGLIVEISGNTAPDGGREGDGVYRRHRELTAVNLGYLDFSRMSYPEPVA